MLFPSPLCQPPPAAGHSLVFPSEPLNSPCMQQRREAASGGRGCRVMHPAVPARVLLCDGNKRSCDGVAGNEPDPVASWGHPGRGQPPLPRAGEPRGLLSGAPRCMGRIWQALTQLFSCLHPCEAARAKVSGSCPLAPTPSCLSAAQSIFQHLGLAFPNLSSLLFPLSCCFFM